MFSLHIPKAKFGIISEMLTNLEVAKLSGWQMHSRAHHIPFCALNKAIVGPSKLPLEAL